MQIKLKNGENTIKIYVSDVRNMIVEVTRINSKGAPETKKGFYHSLEHALKYIIEDFPYLSRDKTIKDLQNTLISLKEQIFEELERLELPTNEQLLDLKKTESVEVVDDEDDDFDDEDFEAGDFEDDEDWE